MERKTTLTAGVFNLCKSAVGVGILSLPYSMRMSGLNLGLALLAFGSVTTSSTLHFLARIAANTELGDYYAVGKLAYGKWGEISAVTATMLYLFGALIAYANYTSTYFAGFLAYVLGVPADSRFYVHRRFIIGISAMLIFPLALLRDLSKLAKASIIGMMCMGLVCILTVADYFVDQTTVPDYTYVNWSTTALQAFTSILFAFCNHFTMLAIVPTMINPTPARRTRMLLISSTVVFVFYLLVSLFGYLHFGDGVNKDILMAPKEMTLPYAIAQLLVGTVIILSFPLLCDPTKASMDFLVSQVIGSPTNSATKQLRNFAITAILVFGAAIVAMFSSKAMWPILGAFTSLCGSLLMFVFPSLYFLRLSSKYSISSIERAAAYFNIVIGIIVLIFGTYFNVLDIWNIFKNG